MMLIIFPGDVAFEWNLGEKIPDTTRLADDADIPSQIYATGDELSWILSHSAFRSTHQLRLPSNRAQSFRRFDAAAEIWKWLLNADKARKAMITGDEFILLTQKEQMEALHANNPTQEV